MNRKITLQDQFDFFLETMKLSKEAMPPQEYQERKRCFAGGMGQFLVLVLGCDDEQTMFRVMTRIQNELDFFWKGESIAHDLKYKL